MIPKIIYQIWLSETPNDIPPLIAKCLRSHHIDSYEVRYITLENCFKGTKYIQECLEAKRWAKAADYLRVHYLNETGGIYLDADVEVFSTFDAFLEHSLFCGEEENGFVSNAIIGATKGHPILKDYLGKVERNFIGSGDLVFQPGMFLFTEIVRYSAGATVYPPEYFLPYDWQTGQTNITENTVCIHHFAKTWLK